MTELLKAPVSEKLSISTDHPHFLYKTKLNEKQKVGGQNHMKNNDAFEKPYHELQQDTSIAYPPASSGSARPMRNVVCITQFMDIPVLRTAFKTIIQSGTVTK